MIDIALLTKSNQALNQACAQLGIDLANAVANNKLLGIEKAELEARIKALEAEAAKAAPAAEEKGGAAEHNVTTHGQKGGVTAGRVITK